MTRETEHVRLEDRLRRDAVGHQAWLAARRRAETAAGRAGVVDVTWTRHESPIGWLVLAASPAGVLTISFAEVDETLDRLAHRVSPRILAGDQRLERLRFELDEYFSGARHSFELPLDWSLSVGFRERVLHELARVRFGETVSYAELAERSGSPRAHRAVGSAMATNPIPIVLPCHRVLRTGGALGGYAGGLDAKRWLLVHEGIEPPAA